MMNKLGLYGHYLYAREQLQSRSPEAKDYKARLIDFYQPFVQPGSLCFDIGANTGNRVETFLALGAHVVAVEPQAMCQDILRRKYVNDSRVQLVPKVLGEAEGEIQLRKCTYHKRASVSQAYQDFNEATDNGAIWFDTQTVPMTTLDQLIAAYGRPDFCKIDVEGYELPVLKGLSQPLPALSFEYHSQTADLLSPVLQCLAYLNTLGDYEFNYSVRESLSLSLAHWVDGQEMRRILLERLFEHPRDCDGDIYARLKTAPQH